MKRFEIDGISVSRRDIIAIGGSLGSVGAIRQLCRDLPESLVATLFVVIHVGDKGRDLLASIFGEGSRLPVSTAVDGEVLQPRHVYVAPADRHLLVIGDVIRLGRGPRENMARPAIDPLFRSVAASFGPRAVAVVLSGLLNDGTAGLADVQRCGGVTVVQNPADAAAPDMPSSALSGTDVDYRASLADMASLIGSLAEQEAGPSMSVPHDIESEVNIALGRRSDSETLARWADPVALSCPDCGGVLSQIKRWPPLRFRCQVGHSYTAEALVTRKEGAVDEAIRVALRIMEERVTLTKKLAQDARRSGHQAAAASYDRRTQESKESANVLRDAIDQTS